jgi:hypothetical protein
LEVIQEQTRQVPVVSAWDVIVCGAGPAGIAAAIAAARKGAKTCLIETHGCLGGIWTAGSLSYILDGRNKGGILTEILQRLNVIKTRQGYSSDETSNKGYVCDVESTKLVLEEMCAEAGVHVRLHTRVVHALKDGQNRLSHVVTESKSGREAWAAQVFVDTTGDGDLAAQAGCGFALGEEKTGVLQPMSLIALVAGVDPEQCAQYTKVEKQSRINLLADIRRGGFEPSYGSPGLWHIKDDLYILMANHEYGASAVNADDITKATLSARKELHQIIEVLRSLGGIWSRLQLVSTGAQIGVREGRRIAGRYTVTIEDIMQGKKHDDGVCRVTFGVDVHSPNPQESRAMSAYNDQYRGRIQAYDIPLRALIARDVDGLLMAGRCISGDFLAHSSYRVTGNAVTMGHAAGTLAAVSSQRGQQPHEIPWQDVLGATPVN